MTKDEPGEHPGLILKEKFLDPLGISPSELADSLGVSRRRLADLIKGRRLSPDMAHRLALYFNVPALWFLEMQARYDAHLPNAKAELRSLVRPWKRKAGLIVTPGGPIPVQKSADSVVGPLSVPVSDDFVNRLRAQVALSGRKVNRRPKTIFLPDGTPVLTGD